MSWFKFSAILLLTSFAGTIFVPYAMADDDCPPGYHKVGEDTEETATEIILHSICKRNAASPETLARTRFCKARGLIAGDQKGLLALDFKSDVAEYEKFQAIASDQKTSFEHKAFDAVLDQAFEVAEKGADAIKPLNPWSVNQSIKKLKSQGYANETLFAAMRKVAAAKDKPARVEAFKAFIKGFKTGHEGADTAIDMHEDPGNAGWRLALGALKIVQGNPELGLVVTSVEFGESFAYLYYLNDQLAEKDVLTDQKLSSLARLSANLKKHVSELKSAKADWQKAGGTGNEPSCD